MAMDADDMDLDPDLGQDEGQVQTNELRVGLTRPPMFKGVPLAPFMIGMGAVGWVYILSGNPTTALIALPVYGILRVISAKNVRIFAEIAARFRIATRCRNRKFWGALSFSPRNVTKWEKC